MALTLLLQISTIEAKQKQTEVISFSSSILITEGVFAVREDSQACTCCCDRETKLNRQLVMISL